MTAAWLPIVGLLLAVDEAPAVPDLATPAQAGSAQPAAPAKAPTAHGAAAKTASAAPKPIDVPLPPPPVLRPRPAAPKPVEKPTAAQPPPAAAPPPAADLAAADLAAGERLFEQKCSKCHDVAWAFSAELSDAQWRKHMKRMDSRPGAAITEDQAHQIQRALRARRGLPVAP